jgi:hypothetical protein
MPAFGAATYAKLRSPERRRGASAVLLREAHVITAKVFDLPAGTALWPQLTRSYSSNGRARWARGKRLGPLGALCGVTVRLR